ncbi:CAP domain-containing protein [Stigmatella sp. ncwal1]|uniref:CAP domain-containing protein n=1 Tax=Stigmatella ashevillensis TaxID=2995309 RepID=A0ABT5DFY2_9BACT|nr:CAP domain-containing protein [Stigmatella ashevillena]MDC0712474.1 CAP domain-containing protein [Stigmatella ashevillena]
MRSVPGALRPFFPSLLLSLCLAVISGGCDSGESETPDAPDGGTSDGGTSDGGSPDGTSEFARDMLTEHNRVRAVANPTPSPALPVLTWSETAASTAQKWVDGCRFAHNPNRGNFGENIAAATPGGLNTLGVVRTWAAEASDFDYARNTCSPGKVCGHYTQLVWRNTTQVGCAMKECSENSPFQGFTRWNFWVCNYSPPGNFAGQRPY